MDKAEQEHGLQQIVEAFTKGLTVLKEAIDMVC